MKKKQVKIFFVTGKGGVGKTLLSLALTKAFLKKGLKAKCITFNSLDKEDLAFKQVLKTVPQQEYSVTDCLSEYLNHFIPGKALIKKALSNKLSLVVLNVTPGLEDVARLGKITSGPRGFQEVKEDVLVVDSYSTGHFQALLKAPQSFCDIVPVGHIKTVCKEIEETLKNSHFIVTSLPEKWSLMETKEILDFLKNFGASRVYHVVNRVFKKDFSKELEGIKDHSKLPKTFCFYKKTYFEQKENLKNVKRDLDVSDVCTLSSKEIIESLSNEWRSFCKEF